MYGTLATRIFQPGEKGLLDSNVTIGESLAVPVKKAPEWERYTQYGVNERKKRKQDIPSGTKDNNPITGTNSSSKAKVHPTNK